MASSNLLYSIILLMSTLILPSSSSNSKLFRAYIRTVSFSDVPIHPDVDFHFILSFAIDYTTTARSPAHTDGEFNIFWDTDSLKPSHVVSVKQSHRNAKVALSLGGDSLGHGKVYFHPSSVDSWVRNAVSSLTKILDEYNFDGIDIDYEHFLAGPDTFADCVGWLLTTLKTSKVISFASIAPSEDDEVQSHHLALWKKYGHVIDYINFQFYPYDNITTLPQFLEYFETQSSNYYGGKVVVDCYQSMDCSMHAVFLRCRGNFMVSSSGLQITLKAMASITRIYRRICWPVSNNYPCLFVLI